ncbi:PcfJ domain-containing protein [Noviherbaspirillum pedocola]|uniref:PcfJ domain-containing protein n=1 Tax=Noviherbaspirillum pedocola TaxID=2801341 RepID=A0A934T1Q2_9BURK|nr:PcfJ domain-containing protein [Noviherbaspirillum pedocola]MBK4735998.1 PcfJ domain-containing protein [Noviherbaspirillum pedocola]
MKQLELHEDMGPAIIARLREITDLPDEGYVAGQAVSSAVLEFFGCDWGISYNDVDLFRVATKEERAARQALVEAEEQRREKHYEAGTEYRYRPPNNLCTFTRPSYHFSAYGELRLSCNTRYSVLTTYRSGMLNTVACSGLERGVGHLLDTFDLNNVQVGVDLKEGKLVWTPAFARFLKTRQLQIVTLHTPFHSVIRFFRKLKELAGVCGDRQSAAELVIAAFEKIRQRKPKAPTVVSTYNLRWKFGEIYRAKFESVAEELAPYFGLVETKLREYSIYTLQPRIAAPENLLATVRAWDRDIVHRLPLVANVLRGMQRSGARAATDFLIKGAGPALEQCWLALGQGFEGNVLVEDVKRINKTLKKHPFLLDHFIGLTLDQQQQAITILRDESQWRGLWVYGVVERAQEWSWDKDDVQTQLDAAEIRLGQVLKTPLLPTMMIGGFEIRELTTGRDLYTEGAELHHCVAGYAEAIEAGSCAIFAVRRGAQAKTWMTLELHRRPGRWGIVQFKGLQNRFATDEEAAIAERFTSYYNVAFYFGRTALSLIQWMPNHRHAKAIAWCSQQAKWLDKKAIAQELSSWKRRIADRMAQSLDLPSYIVDSNWSHLHPRCARYWAHAGKILIRRTPLGKYLPKLPEPMEDFDIPF